MHSDGTATDGTIRAADAVTIRAARPDDIVSVVQLHSDAFHDIFTAAFGAAHVQRGIDAMVLAWRRQGVLALRGMAVATLGAQLVGTIALRTAEMRDDRLPPAELAFHQVLGWWGATRAMLVLSRIEHHVAQDEGYITDVAVHTAYRRRGIAQGLLQRAEAEGDEPGGRRERGRGDGLADAVHGSARESRAGRNGSGRPGLFPERKQPIGGPFPPSCHGFRPSRRAGNMLA